MPQELHVLQCYNCKIFQVDIIKKLPKWSCKMCGEKQSVKKVFFKGNGKECRLYVQELNEKRIRFETDISNQESSKPRSKSFAVIEHKNRDVDNKENSKWLELIENGETSDENAKSNDEISSLKWNQLVSEHKSSWQNSEQEFRSQNPGTNGNEFLNTDQSILKSLNYKQKNENAQNFNYEQEYKEVNKNKLLENIFHEQIVEGIGIEVTNSKWNQFISKNESDNQNLEKGDISLNTIDHSIFKGVIRKDRDENSDVIDLHCKKLKSNPKEEISRDLYKQTHQLENIFDSYDNYDIESLLEI